MCLLAICMSFGEMSIQVFCPFFGSFFISSKFIYFWLHWVFVALHGLSLVVASGCYSLLQGMDFSLQWLLLLWITKLQTFKFQQLQHMGSVVAAHGLQGTQARVVTAPGPGSCSSEALAHGLSSCGAQTQLLPGMWNLPRPGIKHTSPALAGRFLSTVPLRKFLLPIKKIFFHQ